MRGVVLVVLLLLLLIGDSNVGGEGGGGGGGGGGNEGACEGVGPVILVGCGDVEVEAFAEGLAVAAWVGIGCEHSC